MIAGWIIILSGYLLNIQLFSPCMFVFFDRCECKHSQFVGGTELEQCQTTSTVLHWRFDLIILLL